jgi:hypothetical protein
MFPFETAASDRRANGQQNLCSVIQKKSFATVSGITRLTRRYSSLDHLVGDLLQK